MANRNDEFELLGKDNSNNNTVEEEFTHTQSSRISKLHNQEKYFLETTNFQEEDRRQITPYYYNNQDIVERFRDSTYYSNSYVTDNIAIEHISELYNDKYTSRWDDNDQY